MSSRPVLSLACLICLAATACAPVQSAFAPAGPHARSVAALTWVLFVGGGAILVLVMALLALAIFAPPRWRAWLGHRNAVIGLGIVFPVVTLTALLITSVLMFRGAVGRGSGEPDVRIEVIGERFWWRVNYLAPDGSVRFTTANEIAVPVGVDVEYVLKAADVIHSFWVPSLAGKLDMIPGRTNVYRFQADRPGLYRGQCAEFCGEQHTYMAFFVRALHPEAFAAWTEAQARPAAEPEDETLSQGRELFLTNGCGNCHRIAGTPAAGTFGPDLTHVGSRLTLGAGLLPRNVGTLGGWIASTQHLKGDAMMPSYGTLEGVELRALAAYLESLK